MNKLAVKVVTAKAMEYVRPVGIGVLIFVSKYFGGTAAEEFTIIGPGLVILMCGTISFEGLYLGAVGSEKLGYTPNKGYQRQCALYSLAIALTAVLALVFKWGTHAYVTVTVTMLLFFLLSGSNHLYTALKEGNKSKTNFLRPILSAILIIYLVPMILKVLK
ncbi:MAG: hypothetical protein PF692_15450 [Kiritimatiellae bacterium]|jgi:hypothetical protein|nr:hypothetical protein [Kiritimatiellia bacterium]